MSKGKCYIAGKITGIWPQAAVVKKFYEAKLHLLQEGYEPVSPIELAHQHDRTWNDYMKEDIRALLQCDYLFALSDCGLSPGATIEIELAKKLGIKIIYQSHG